MMSNSPTSSIVECTADSGVLWRPRESSCVAPTRLWVSMQPSRTIYLLWLLSMGAMVNQWIFSYVCIPSSARSTHPPHTAWFEKRFLLFNPSNTTHTLHPHSAKTFLPQKFHGSFGIVGEVERAHKELSGASTHECINDLIDSCQKLITHQGVFFDVTVSVPRCL